MRHLSSGSVLASSTGDVSVWRSRIRRAKNLQTAGVFVTNEWFANHESGLQNDAASASLYEGLWRPLKAQRYALTTHLVSIAKTMLSPGDRLTSALQFEARALDMLVAMAQLSVPQADAQVRLRSIDRDRVCAVREAIRSDPCATPTIAALAESFGISASKLKRDYRTYFEACLGRDIIVARLEAGFALLRDGARVSEVAYKLGYDHPTNFATAFRRHYGMSPKASKLQMKDPDDQQD